MIRLLRKLVFWLTVPLARWRLSRQGVTVEDGAAVPPRGNWLARFSIGQGVYLGSAVVVEPGAAIEQGAWIGARARVAAGVTVRRGARVEERSRVLDSVPEYGVVRGDPAQLVGYCKSVEPVVTPPLFGEQAMRLLLALHDFDSVLDVGSGSGRHAAMFRRHGKRVTCVDLGVSDVFRRAAAHRVVEADYMAVRLDHQFDCIWACHVLEHQPNPNLFLRKVHHDLRDDGLVAVTVPPMKHDIVGGHVTWWNAGMLLYQMVLAGFDCRDASVREYGYNISVVVKKKTAELPQLHYDHGDVARLQEFFPVPVVEGFDGRIARVNWPDVQFEL